MKLPENYKEVENLSYVIQKGDFYNKQSEGWWPVSGSIGITYHIAIARYGNIKFATKVIEPIKPRFKNPRPYPHGY